MSWTRKIEPLLDEVIIGLLFIIVGYNLWIQLNESIFGLVGIIAICWGGFKLLIGLYIYGVSLYAILFDRECFVSVQEKRQIIRIKKRIKRDLEKHEIDNAIRRLHYLTYKYPNRAELKDELANLYIKEQKPISAGRQLYFKSDLTTAEHAYVQSFIKSNGSDAFQILRRVIHARRVDIDFLRRNKKKVLELLQEINIDSEKNSWIVNNLRQKLATINIPVYKQILINKKDALKNCGALLLLMALQILTSK